MLLPNKIVLQLRFKLKIVYFVHVYKVNSINFHFYRSLLSPGDPHGLIYAPYADYTNYTALAASPLLTEYATADHSGGLFARWLVPPIFMCYPRPGAPLCYYYAPRRWLRRAEVILHLIFVIVEMLNHIFVIVFVIYPIDCAKFVKNYNCFH